MPYISHVCLSRKEWHGLLTCGWWLHYSSVIITVAAAHEAPLAEYIHEQRYMAYWQYWSIIISYTALRLTLFLSPYACLYLQLTEYNTVCYLPVFRWLHHVRPPPPPATQRSQYYLDPVLAIRHDIDIDHTFWTRYRSRKQRSHLACSSGSPRIHTLFRAYQQIGV